MCRDYDLSSSIINNINSKFIGEKIDLELSKRFKQSLVKEVTLLKSQLGYLPEHVKSYAGDVLAADPIDLRYLTGYRELCVKK